MPSMTNGDGATDGLAVILVAYHLSEADKAFALVDDFCKRMRLPYSIAIVVDNGGSMKQLADNAGRRRVILGDNSAWEFTGWLKGMDAMFGTNFPVVALLNDSYGRNWSLSPLSLAYLSRMYRAARNGCVAGWLDNFSYITPPRFSRRSNSRIVFVPGTALQSLSLSLHQAIATLRVLREEGSPLFSADETACLDRWAKSQPGRWAPQTLPYRKQRIFLEHHMFDGLAPRLLRFFPGTWLGSLVYGVFRRVLGERR